MSAEIVVRPSGPGIPALIVMAGERAAWRLLEFFTVNIRADHKGPLFRAAIGRTKTLSPRSVLRSDVWAMVRRRAADAGIETAIGYHAFRATGITDYLTNGGRIEAAQRMAGHSNAKPAVSMTAATTT